MFAEPLPLLDGAAAAGEPLAVLPVLLHLLWSHELAVDVSVPPHGSCWLSRTAAKPSPKSCWSASRSTSPVGSPDSSLPTPRRPGGGARRELEATRSSRYSQMSPLFLNSGRT